MQAVLADRLTLDDWGLHVAAVPKKRSTDRWPRRHDYLSVESDRLLLEPAVVDAATAAASDDGDRSTPTLVYLANDLADGRSKPPRSGVPYSIVAGVDPKAPRPLNPLWPDGRDAPLDLADGDIALTEWTAKALKVGVNDTVAMTYFTPDVEGQVADRLPETTRSFRISALVPLAGPAADPDLVPEFPGITDQLDVRKWKPPFPYDGSRMTKHDEGYWKDFGPTPKAYVTLATARNLFKSRFGDATSVRVAPADGRPLDAAAFGKLLLTKLDAKRGGFVFDDVKERLVEAGGGSQDFGMLFASFSFFLIAAALMLVGLLFRLNLERRAGEIGLLRSVGYSLGRVRRMLLAEGLIFAALGALGGLALAPLYAGAMLKLLIALWPDRSVGAVLTRHVGPLSMIAGFVGTVVMAGVAVWWALRGLAKIEPAALLKGTVSPPDPAGGGRTRKARWLVGIGVVGAVALIAAGPALPPGEPRAGAFFGAGSLLLAAGLALAWIWLKRPATATLLPGRNALIRLGVRNARRNPGRSMLTAGLLASAAFLLVGVESFHREPEKDFAAKAGGSGGFPIIGETDAPVYFDVTDPDGRAEIEHLLALSFAAAGREDPDALAATAAKPLDGATVMPFRVRAGDDASCLNLYRATRPRVVGAPPALVERGGFQFSGTLAATQSDKDNPWRLLDAVGPDASDPVPAFVEENTATWMLKVGLGDAIEVPDAEAPAAGQDRRPAEGQRLPERGGGVAGRVPVAVPARRGGRALPDRRPRPGRRRGDTPRRAVAVRVRVGTGGQAARRLSRGAEHVPGDVPGARRLRPAAGRAGAGGGGAAERLGAAARVGTAAGAGLPGAALGVLVLAENVLLLAAGLGLGVVAALGAVLPAGGATVPWGRLAGLLGLVVLAGLAAAVLALARSLRTPVLEALRRE